MKQLKKDSLKDVFLHLLVILGIGTIFLLSFFYIFLPTYTNHGESITVPDLKGIAYQDLNEFLTDRNLRFEVTADSAFSSEYPPLAVLQQNPNPGSKVKEHRKIYVTLNAKNPPKVKMPKLVDGSLKNAQMVLQSYGLLLGDITYKPDQFQNAVLGQKYKGKPIEEGSYVPKGSKIDLVVGNGLGAPFPAPNVMGYKEDEAEFIIIGSGLKVGKVTTVKQDTLKDPKQVVRQFPGPGENIRTGNTIDIWITPDKEVDKSILGKESKGGF